MTNNLPSPQRRRLWLGAGGFTLVEVTLAMGLVAFALVAILGALPVGLQTVQDAQAQQVAGSIAQQMQANLQQLSFLVGSTASGSSTQLTVNANNLSGLKLFYTVDGAEIPSLAQYPTGVSVASSSTTTNPAPAFYQATFSVAASQAYGATYGTPAPASTYNATPPNDSWTITITLNYPQQGSTAGPRSVAYSFVVARQRID